MMIKVCGMTREEDIRALFGAGINMMGFIFYPKSPRYLKEAWNSTWLEEFPQAIKKVGVFVNEGLETILAKARTFKLDAIQLHGQEAPGYCAEIKKTGLQTIKAFRVNERFLFQEAENYQDVADWFLFDAFTKQYGGSGKKFNWEKLESYTLDTPFLLSGGIGPGDGKRIREINHPAFAGIDLNSQFETAPGIKDTGRVKEFIKTLNTKDNAG